MGLSLEGLTSVSLTSTAFRLPSEQCVQVWMVLTRVWIDQGLEQSRDGYYRGSEGGKGGGAQGDALLSQEREKN